MQFPQTCREIVLKTAEVFHSIPRKTMSWYFFQKKYTPTLFLWNLKMQFWQVRRKSFAGSLTIFCSSCRKSVDYTFVWKCVPQKWSSAQVEWNFHFLGKNMLLSGRNVFAECPKKIKIRTFPSQHFPSKLIPEDTQLQCMFSLTQRTFFLKLRNYLRTHKF